MKQQVLAPLILTFASLISAPDCHAIRILQDNPTGGDCTLVGTWDDAGKTCTLNQDVADTIQIDSSNTVLDCNGHQITYGPEASYAGVALAWVAGLTNVTVKNCDISGFTIGIDCWPNGAISGFKAISNNVHDSEYGIYVGNSSTGLISDNIINNPNGHGIYLFASSEMEVSGNTIEGPGAAYSYPYGRGVFVSGGSGDNDVINNYISDTFIPIYVLGWVNNILISGNIIDSGVWGISTEIHHSTIENNDITGMSYTSIDVVGSDNIIANNYVHESTVLRVHSYPIDGGEANHNIVENNIVENGLACEEPCHTFDYQNEMGILLSSISSQRDLGNTFYGDGLTDENVIRGNIIRNMVGEGIYLDSAGDNNMLANNVITKNAGGGITIAHPCPGCNYNFIRNDIYHNGGLPLKSIDTEIIGSWPWTRNELGPEPIDVAGQDDLGNTIGNWWNGNCGGGLWQASFSNDPSVYDSKPYRHAVAKIPADIAPMPKVCPN
jgi:parallel beta-helix repeat protein